MTERVVITTDETPLLYSEGALVLPDATPKPMREDDRWEAYHNSEAEGDPDDGDSGESIEEGAPDPDWGKKD